MKPLPKKSPAKRMFSGMAGSPLAVVGKAAPAAVAVLEPEPVRLEPAVSPAPSVVQVQMQVTNLMEAVNRVEGDEKVKQVVREILTLPPPAPAPKSPSLAAIRAKKWRDKQKQHNQNFAEEEAERKQNERKEVEREHKLQQALESGQFPKGVSALQLKNGPRLVLKDAPEGLGLVVTGGYNGTKIDVVTAAHLRTLGGLYQGVSLARPNRPAGAGPDTDAEPGPERSTYVYIPEKDVRTMRDFIRGCTDTKPMMVCEFCQEQLHPDFSFAAGFNHLQDKHPGQFDIMLERIRTQTKHGCTEDHEGMAKRHGNGSRKAYCGKCWKLVYKPPKPGRSDKPKKSPNTFKLLITLPDTPE